jgi:PIN domain nuclease of toxin-antitoxin system
MRLLLDTHALLWWLDGDTKLPRGVRGLINNETNEILVSAASAWEISTKARLGKLMVSGNVAHRLSAILFEQGFTPVPVTVEHGQRAGSLPGLHRDPFDRMLAAQAQALGVPVATSDAVFPALGVQVIW